MSMNTSEPVRVVVGVSGSPASRQAVEAAAREADIRGCPLHLAHVFDWLPDSADDPGTARDLLRQAAATAARLAPALTITTELVEGSPLSGLLRLSRHAALTAIGDGNLNDLCCLPLESLAVQLSARAFGTVMVTRAAPAPSGPVFVGVDDCPAAEPVLDFAFDVAAHRRNGLLVVRVGEAGICADALENAIGSRALAYGVDARLRVLEGDPTAVMIRESQAASLIVVGARGQLPYHGLLGSVAQTLLHHGRAPVAVVRGTLHAPCRPASAVASTKRAVTACARVPDAPAPRQTLEASSS